MPDLCGQWTGQRVEMSTGEVRAGAIWCKSWACDYCAPIRQKQLMAQAADGHPTKFITLTSRYRPDLMSVNEAAQELVHAWRMVVQRGKRDGIFSNVQYIAVFELTQKGWPHLHILARCTFLPQKWLSLRMAEYADSPIVHVRSVDSRKRAAWYIGKYASKAPEKFEGCKRYWRTLSYDLSEKRPDKPLHDLIRGYMSQQHFSFVSEFYQLHDYTIQWDSEHSFTAYPSSFDVHAIARRKWLHAHDPPYKEHRPWKLN